VDSDRLDPPVNVRLVYPGGRMVAVDCIYAGTFAGIHHWKVCNMRDRENVTGVLIQHLPNNTHVIVPGLGEAT